MHTGLADSMCRIYSHIMTDSDVALCCDQCNVSCEPNVSLDFYNELVFLMIYCSVHNL